MNTYRKNIAKSSKSLLFVALAFILVASFAFRAQPGARVEAQSADELRQKTEALKATLDENNSKAKSLEVQVGSLQDKLAGINTSISTITTQISETEAEIAALTVKLTETEAELVRQKDLLKASFRNLYQKSGVSSIELLVGSDSFSDYFNGQTYLERIRSGIQVSTNKVVELKNQVIAQKKQQEDLAVQQKVQKQALDDVKAEQVRLIDVTKGEQSKYEQLVKQNEEDLVKAQAELNALLERLAREAAERARKAAAGNGGGPVVTYGRVVRGQRIGSVGSTGLSTGPHTHFAVYDNGTYIDPVESSGRLINGYVWPLPNSSWGSITQWFGCTDLYLEPRASWCPQGYVHYGLDIAGWYGDPVVAAADGDITYRGWLGGYGFVVIVDHGGGVQTFYPHMIAQ